MKKIRLKTCEIWVGKSIFDKECLSFNNEKLTKVFIIADRRLRSSAQKLVAAQTKLGVRVSIKYVEATEKLKDFCQLDSLYDWLLEHEADRYSTLVAFGGGTIGDVVGFVAGTYLRGIRWVGVPTTLLAQVDSSVGGKTGVNLRHGKNLVGLFYQPARVICDVSFLGTLSKRDLVSGLGEVIKYSLILDPSFFQNLRRKWIELVRFPKSKEGLEKMIFRCLRWKAQLVEKDEFDRTGVREILNFGHTLGHALEVESGYGYFRHGEAVIIGMRIAVYLSSLRGHLGWSLQENIDSCLSSLPVPSIPNRIRTDRLIARLKWDKKARDGKVRFVLLKNIGKAILDPNVTQSEVAQAIEWLKNGKEGSK